MARKIVSKTSFLGGEAGKTLEGRSDLAQFQLGATEIENFVVLKGGAITRRPGTRYVKNTEGDKVARLIPYVISYNDPTKINVLEITQASSTSLVFKLINVATGLATTVTGDTITVASGININEIQYTQSGETLFLCSRYFAPQIFYINRGLSGAGVTPKLEAYVPFVTGSRALWLGMPRRDPNITSTTLSINTASVGTGRTVTASASIFNASMVGGIWDFTATAVPGAFLITAFVDSTHVTVTVLEAIDAAATASTNWAEGSWSPWRGWPRAVTFYNQRIVFGGNTSQPDTFWLSATSNFFEMYDRTSGVDDALNFTLSSDKLNQICWMVGGKKLTIGTTSSEWVGTITESGTNLLVEFDEETNHGSAFVQPSKYAYTIPFVQRSGQVVREMTFDFDSNSYVATDLNLFGSHVAASNGDFSELRNIKIVQTAYQESPFGVLWVLDSAGRLYGLTRDKQQQIAAWHSHNIAGVGDREDDLPAIKSICVVPDIHGTFDRLYMVVKRTINSATQYHVEYLDTIKQLPNLTPHASLPTEIIEGVVYDLVDIRAFLDCCSMRGNISESLGPFSSFDRFSSSQVYAIGLRDNGSISYAGLVNVNSSGEITMPATARSVCAGLHINAYLRLLPFEGGDNPELYMRSEKRADTAAIRLHQTHGLKIGKNRISRKNGWVDNETFEPIKFDESELPILPTFTGIKEATLPTDLDRDGSFALAMDGPWPCTILSICSRVVGNEI